MTLVRKSDIVGIEKHEIRLPLLGEGIEKAVVAGWNVDEGKAVEADQEIVDVVTDKATFSITADCSGVVEKILVKEGCEAAIGEVLAVIRRD